MILIVVPILIVCFLATRYGIKSNSKTTRAFSYAGIFLSMVLLTLLAFALVIERLEN